MTNKGLLAEVKAVRSKFKAKKVWFWRPSWYWFGWDALLPFNRGHDEFSRSTVVLGWTITGRVIIPLWSCGDEDCYTQTLLWNDWTDEELDEMSGK